MITVDDALAYKTFNVTVDGASEQETTTGKNLLNYLNVKQFVSGGLLSIINNDGSITTTGTPTTKYVPILESINITDMLEDGQTYTIMQKNATNKLYIQVTITTNSDEISYIGLNNNTENIKTFTVDKQNNKKYSINIQSNIIETTGELNITNYYQLLKGSYDEWQPFEKYTGGQPSPSSDYPQEITTLTFDKITRRGKNLLDNVAISRTVNGLTFTVNEDKTITVNGTATKYTNVTLSGPNNKLLIPITGNYISGGTNNVRFQIMNAETGSYISLASSNSYGSTSINKTQFNRGYFEIIVIEGTTVNNEVVKPMMTMEPITSEEYEPYQGQTYDIDLQGNEMVELPNGVKDELVVDKYGNVSLIKNIGKVILDGSENNWDWNMITEDEKYRFSTGVIQSLVEPSTPCLSNYFMSGSADDGDYFVENTIEIAPSGGITICTYAVSNSIEEFRAWLQEHNVIVYYQLANPQLIPLGTLSELITTLNGTNNIFINGNIPTTISITYALDIKKYIDNKLAEISTAMIEEG